MADTPTGETPAKPAAPAKKPAAKKPSATSRASTAKPARTTAAKKPAAKTGSTRGAIGKAEAEVSALAKSASTRAKAAAGKAKAGAAKVKDKLPPATPRNVAIGAAAAVVAVGAGLAATVGRKRIAKASGEVVETVKKKIADTRARTTKAKTPTEPNP